MEHIRNYEIPRPDILQDDIRRERDGLLAEVAALKSRIRKFEYLLGHPVAWAVPSELQWLKSQSTKKQVPCVDVYAVGHKRATTPLYGAVGWENQILDLPTETQ